MPQLSTTEKSIRTAKRLIKDLRAKVFGKTQKTLSRTAEVPKETKGETKKQKRIRQNLELRRKFMRN